MRVNMPVTQRNHPVPEGTTIVTRTDAKGRIVHANEAFVEVSGFSREELLGQPHNMVRHPDMPAEAFRDMWATLKRGRPWSGLVKNRRKDGGHYWVRANANPLPDGGYHSVRTAPGAQEIAAAEALYARMRAGEAIKLHEGRVVGRGLFAGLRVRLQRVTIAQRFWAWAAFATALFYLSIFLGVYGLNEARNSLQRLYDTNMLPALQLGEVAERLDGGHGELLLALQLAAQQQPGAPVEAVRAQREQLEQHWSRYRQSAGLGGSATDLEAFSTAMAAWWRQLEALAARIQRGDAGPDVLQALLAARNGEGAAAHAALEALRRTQASSASGEVALLNARHQREFIIYAVLFGLGVTLGTLMGWSVLRRLKHGFAIAGEAAQAIAVGNLSIQVPADGEDEIGRFARADEHHAQQPAGDHRRVAPQHGRTVEPGKRARRGLGQCLGHGGEPGRSDEQHGRGGRAVVGVHRPGRRQRRRCAHRDAGFGAAFRGERAHHPRDHRRDAPHRRLRLGNGHRHSRAEGPGR